MRDLNRCPFCGGVQAHVAEWFDNDNGEASYYVVCDECGYEAETKLGSYEEAVDHWNRRASAELHNDDEGEKGLYYEAK